MEIQFDNLEKIDGYFSGTMQIKGINGDFFIVEFGYDIDTCKLNFWNCKALLVDSEMMMYEPYDVADFWDRFGWRLREDVYGELVLRYGPQQSFEEYETDAYHEEIGD